MTKEQRSDLFIKWLLIVAATYFIGHIALYLVRL